MVYREFDLPERDNSKKLREIINRGNTGKQCQWKCPYCNHQCGGFEGHPGGHQCITHSEIPPLQWKENKLIRRLPK